MKTVTLKLPEKLLTDAARVASGQDVTNGHLVRVLLAKEVARRLNPKTPKRADAGLLAALQTLLGRDMADASDWDDLALRLQRMDTSCALLVGAFPCTKQATVHVSSKHPSWVLPTGRSCTASAPLCPDIRTVPWAKTSLRSSDLRCF
ncbi:hypothetical protein Z945_147 [Sulfitobacter noctilucae]|uniref:hypothetical protein n=1 Tax=Sulfitobacter noctilucae TaxID=1342302 RepID=UPI0013788F38|nr:hypothetical protein [Sulfitobacter noctilucae]KIN75318.1 hypothetical protein Z945_147 [Sulfitobacter noctilucae]